MLRFGGMWGIWLNRNNLIFNQKKFHIIEVVEHVKIKVWNWMKATGVWLFLICLVVKSYSMYWNCGFIGVITQVCLVGYCSTCCSVLSVTGGGNFFATMKCFGLYSVFLHLGLMISHWWWEFLHNCEFLLIVLYNFVLGFVVTVV